MAGITFSEGSGVNNSIFGASQNPIKMLIEDKAKPWQDKSILDRLFFMTTSKNYGEEIASLTGTKGFVPGGENEEYPNDEMREGYSKFLRHFTWRDQFTVTQEMVEDSKLLNFQQKPQKFINGFYETREKYGHALYGAALGGKSKAKFRGTEFDITTADRKPLFDNEHPSILNAKFKQSNKFADAFSVDALGAAESAMQNFRDDNGDVLDIRPDTIIIANDYKLKKAVFEAIGADKDPATANNGFNYQFGRWNVIVSTYFNDYIADGSSPWMLADSQYINDNAAAVWYDRVNLTIKSDIDDKDNNRWRGRARFVAGFSDWRFAAAGGITGGTALIS